MSNAHVAQGTPRATAPPPVHPMDPARGERLSPQFAALLCWAIGRPAITGVAVSGACVYATTTNDPCFNALIGAWDDVEANLRGWGTACRADPAAVDGLVDTVHRGTHERPRRSAARLRPPP